ncbi:MAG: DUF3108 domain-containing protein [Bacteroidetes bacterium]|nr:DUF3108 domain-containing protein [Bacteroidota bacterium]
MRHASKRFIFIFLLIHLFWIKPYSQTTGDCKIKNLSTRSGETLHYKVYYTLAGAYLGAGEATFSNTLSTYNHKPVYHVKGVGRTYKSYDWFYKVRDVYESYIDTTTMLPVKFVRNVHEGNTQIYSQVLFKQQEKKAVSTNGSFDVPACVQDVLSAIYYARNIDFSKYKAGDKIPFSIFIDDQVFPIYIRYVGKEKLHTKYGDYQTIKFKPLLIDGTIFTGGENMTVWVTDDLNKLPVLIETPILVGSIKVYLKRYEGLRNKTAGILNENIE